MPARVCLLLLSLVSACFSPDTSNVTWTCTTDTGCPTNFNCVRGRCYERGADLSAEFTDLGASTGDGGASPSGCRNAAGGHRLSDRAWACDGPFKKGQALNVCADGFWPCTTLQPEELSACKKTPGFFISQNFLWTRNFDLCSSIDPMFVSCSMTGAYTYRYRMGCGLDDKGSAKWCDHKCQAFDQGISCMRFKPPMYTCGSNQLPTDDESTAPEIGVLCCPM